MLSEFSKVRVMEDNFSHGPSGEIGSSLREFQIRGTKRLVSVNICWVEGNSADIFVSKMSPGIFVIKVK